MIYDALEDARYVIYHEEQAGRPVSNLRLQKLLYFIQAKFLIVKHEPCFTERMEAWDFGPVVPTVYHQYRYYGGGIIPFQGSSSFSFHPADQNLIDMMLDNCSMHSTSDLVEKTHQQDPWKNAYASSQMGLDAEISIDSIYKYFVEE